MAVAIIRARASSGRSRILHNMPDEHDSKLFYAPDNKAVEREAQPGVVLFEFSRASDGAHLRCELRDHGEYGVEV